MKNKFTATLPLALLAIGMLGSVTSANAADLNNSIYVALDAPCRVGDTRHTGTASIPAGGHVEWHAYGIDMSGQGGEATGCPQPKTDMTPTGIAVNITAVGNLATAKGNLVAYAADATPPANSVVNYTPGTNIANSTIIGLCKEAPCDGKFKIQSNFANVPAIADVQGYFYARPSGVAQVAIHGGDYRSPVDAMTHLADWCGMPGEFNRCLMKIAPGVYSAHAPIVMQEWVSIQGSGQGETIIAGAESGDATSGLLHGADQASLTDLSIHNDGGSGADHVIGIQNNNASPLIHRVNVVVFGGHANTGIYNQSSARPDIKDAIVAAVGGDTAQGMFNGEGVNLKLIDVTVSGVSATNSNKGMANFHANTVIMTNVLATASGGNTAIGIECINTRCRMQGVHASATGGVTESYAARLISSNVNIKDSALHVSALSSATGIKGYAIFIDRNSASDPEPNVTISESSLEGSNASKALYISPTSPRTNVLNCIIHGGDNSIDNLLPGGNGNKGKRCRYNVDENMEDVTCK